MPSPQLSVKQTGVIRFCPQGPFVLNSPEITFYQLQTFRSFEGKGCGCLGERFDSSRFQKKERKKLNGPSQKQRGGKNKFAIFHLQYEGKTAFHPTSAWRWSPAVTHLLEDPVCGCGCGCVCMCVHADGGGTDGVQCFRPFTDQM